MIGNFLGDQESQPVSRNAEYTPLTIPRRPQWTRKMTAHEIETNENTAFLEWRRDIASIEQNNINLAITPFEKNIDIWRQLWRVIERSDLLLQIVDGRNPYFFYSADLEKYINEVGKGDKHFILLVNKADYLSEELIEHWNKYFLEKGIDHIFFSALKEQQVLDEQTADEEMHQVIDEEEEKKEESEDDSDDQSDQSEDHK